MSNKQIHSRSGPAAPNHAPKRIRFLATLVIGLFYLGWGMGVFAENQDEQGQNSGKQESVKAEVSKPSAADPSLPLLTNVIQIRELSASEASRGYPIRVTGVITFSDNALYLHFVQDQTAGIYIDSQSNPRTASIPLGTGQRVEITGYSGPGDYAPIIHTEHIEILGEGRLPVARPSNVRFLMTGAEDSQWVTLKGVIRSWKDETNRTVLSLSTMDASIDVVLPAGAGVSPAETMVDAAIDVRGVCTTLFNDHRRLEGVTLHVPSWGQIQVLEAAPANPFELPLSPIDELFQFQSGSRLHRVHVRGTVVRQQRDGSFYLQSSHDGIRVETRGPWRPLEVGGVVEAVGFASALDGLPSLQYALVKPVDHNGSLTPAALPRDAELNEELHGTLVKAEGRLLSQSVRTTEQLLTLQCGHQVVDALLETGPGRPQVPQLALGSVVELTGVYAALLDHQRKIRAFQLLLRSPADVTVLSRPSWWTVWHTLWLLGALVAVLLLALAWVRFLRRQVQQRTRQLSAEIEERNRAEEELKKAHGELLRASRLAGMAEVATSVLHNVGNVLNSVNVSINVVFDQVRASRVSSLARVATMLREHSQDLPAFLTADAKGRQLPSYLQQLAEHLAREQSTLIKELESLKRNAGHIKDIVTTQQSYAKVAGVTETIAVADLVEDALRVNLEGLARHDVGLSREFAPNLPPITVDKHKVLQVLVNLIRNAKHACDDAGTADKRLTVRVVNGEGKLKISVIDNGIGIPRENLTRIFNHGFTTRKNGHGFGLHSGALAAQELGGSLQAYSEGTGKGATFTLELPVQAKNPTTCPGSS